MSKLSRAAACCLFSLTVAGLSACNQGPETMPDTAPNLWVTSFNNRDGGTLTDLYTSDCILLPPNAQLVKGRQGVLGTFHYALSHGYQIAMTNEETEVRGDMAYRRGTYELKDKDGSSMEVGKYLQIWRKEERRGWMLSRDFRNTDSQPQIKAPELIP